MNWLTKTFLVLLRLAIGWHFLFEGVEKVSTYYPVRPQVNRTEYGWPVDHPVRPDPTQAKGSNVPKPFSSEAYLRGANGPFADLFHQMAGDRVLDQVDVKPATSQGPDQKYYERLPAGLERTWRPFFDLVVQHYHVTDDQLRLLEARFQQRKDQTVIFLLTGVQPLTTGVTPTIVIPVNAEVPKQIEKYKELVNRMEETPPSQDREELKVEADKLRSDLQKVADGQTDEMKDALLGEITPAQKAEYGPLPQPVYPVMKDWDRLDWIDFATRWGLVVIGGLLLLGLFTRTACVAGALFLLTLWLAMPPFPWLPPNPRAEGHYLYINKNIVEMFALLALATVRSGRWLGLDALFPLLRRRSHAPREIVRQDRVVTEKVVTTEGRPGEKQPVLVEHETKAVQISAPLSPSSTKEPPHGD